MRVIIVGLGLIGGSIAKALKANTDYEILGIDVNEDSVLDAVSCCAIDRRGAYSDIKTADIIYLCTYPDSAVEFTKEYCQSFKPGMILVDSCGIKGKVCEEIEKLRNEKSFIFAGAHPMAGKEKNGFSESTPSLFAGASYIITPCSAPQSAVDTLSELAIQMGFGKVVITTPENHDRLIAFTSQVPHVLACAYVMSPSCKDHKGFSAGSYRDVSRVADINANLWTELFIENKKHLVTELDILIENINNIKQAIADEDMRSLNNLLQIAGDIKRSDNK